MKKLSLLLILCSFFAATSVFAQVWSGSSLNGNTYRNGNVGLEVSNPYARLEIKSAEGPLVESGTGSPLLPHFRLHTELATGGTSVWDITNRNSLNFDYGTTTGNLTRVLTLSNSSFTYSGSRLRIGTGENYYNLGVATSPANNAGHYLAFGADNTAGASAWSFTGNSTNNGGAIIQGDNQGNLFFITRGTAASNTMNTTQTADNVRLFINGSGDVGIGTSAIQAHEQLAVRGGMITTEGIGNGINLNGSYYGTTNDFGTQRYGLFMGDGTQLNLTMSQNTGQKPIVLSSFYGLGFDTNKGKMVLCENGVVVIANDNNIITQLADETDANLEFQLFVQEGIRAERVRVDIHQGNWFDHVFEDGYQLPTLNEVEAFVQKNHHLPDIPSEKEVKANGINLAEMDGLLLKKIEELTLYTIEQQKLLEKLQEQNAALLNRVEQLENQ